MINEYALRHRSKSNFCFAYDEGLIEIRFKSKRDDLKTVELVYGDKYDWENHKRVKMEKVFSDEKFDYYVKRIEAINNRLGYYFKLYDNSLRKKASYFTEWGYVKSIDEEDHGMVQKYILHYPYVNKQDIHEVPSWVKGAVFYQIFPERFDNGDESLNPEGTVAWDSKPTRDNFFGGDLVGIYNRLEYLHELGINAIYMTPIFEATSNHKYDTIDYKKIDPQFGDLETLKKLVKKAHELDIKIVLDCVFNHSGYMFDKFQDVKEKGEESAYKDWFHIHEFPVSEDPLNYETFGFVADMPKLNTENPEVIDFLLDVTTYWIEEADIDGWRLDVANEIDHEFWRMFRKEVKKVKEDAFIVGEIWHNSESWLRGDQFDSIMNYPIQTACYEYFAKETIDLETFKYKVNRTYFDYTTQVNEVMLNLLDSHDTARFITEASGEKDKLVMAFAFELFYLGCTSVYYGTEIGMEGKNDPDCRRSMKWDREKWDKELFNLYKKMIHISNEHQDILKTGDFRWIDTDKCLGFTRTSDAGTIAVLINNSKKTRKVALPGASNCIDLLNGTEVKKPSKIEVEAEDVKILKIK